MHFLLIDDDYENLKQLSSLLQALGHSCELFAVASDAVKSYQASKYDVVITDLVMPFMNGIEVLKLIRQQKPESVVLVISASVNQELMKEIIQYGAYGVLSKPLSIERFIHTIEAISLESTGFEEMESRAAKLQPETDS